MFVLKIQFHRLLNTMLASIVTLVMCLGSFTPLAAHAATCQKLESGTLIKVKGHTAVYLLSGKKNDVGYPYRKYFPNAEVFYSWFSDFSNVVEIDGACIDDYQSGGGINYRPGFYLVKTDVSPNVYAIGSGNKKHLIPDELVASALYGGDWAKKVRILADVFDGNLTKGAPLTDAPHNGMIVKLYGGNALFFVVNGTYQEVDPADVAALAAWANIVTQNSFAKLELSGDTVTKAGILKDPTQDGGLDLSVMQPKTDTLTMPGGKRLTVPWAEGTFSLEIPHAYTRTLNYDVRAIEPDAWSPLGYNASIHISTEGTTYEGADIEWFEPFFIQIIPRDWWDKNVVLSSDGLYEIISMEEGPGKYVTPWFIENDFVYIYNVNAQDCPLLVGSGLDSDLCGIKTFENEINKSFDLGN